MTTTEELFSCPADDASCSFNFSDAATPTITSVTPSTLDTAGTLTIAGTGFSATPGDNTVKIGTATCTATASSDTSITCDVTPHGGSNAVDVNVSGSGYATGTATVDTTLTATSVTNGTGSFAGGQEITVAGTNFSDDVVADICGSLCTYVSHTNTEYVCTAPLMMTEYSYTESLDDHVRQGNGVNAYITEIVNTGTTELSDTYSLSNAFDGDVTTFYKAGTASDCYIGFDSGADYKYVLEAF